jgi:alkylation response protein AidB-like acyl-CoA dehydrogenase
MIIAEEFGRSLVLEPYIESVVLGAALIGSDDGELISRIIDGSAIVAPALYEGVARFSLGRIACKAKASGDGHVLEGTKIVVGGGPLATHFVVSASAGDDDLGIFVVQADAPGIERRDYATIDGRPASDVTFSGAPASRLGASGNALPRIQAAVDCATAALCAEAIGVMDVLLKSTVEYARQREQFGVPIATFQVLQHRMVDMLTQIERSRSLSIMASLSLDLPADERGRAVSAAKAYIGQALQFVGEAAIQIHGGIGTTEELAVSHYFKRATVMQSQFGTSAFHLERMALLDEG